jgi:hypothetical protein
MNDKKNFPLPQSAAEEPLPALGDVEPVNSFSQTSRDPETGELITSPKGESNAAR